MTNTLNGSMGSADMFEAMSAKFAALADEMTQAIPPEYMMARKESRFNRFKSKVKKLISKVVGYFKR